MTMFLLWSQQKFVLMNMANTYASIAKYCTIAHCGRESIGTSALPFDNFDSKSSLAFKIISKSFWNTLLLLEFLTTSSNVRLPLAALKKSFTAQPPLDGSSIIVHDVTFL